MGNDNAFLQDLITRVDAGQVAWPRIVPNGFIEGRSPYSARFGFIPASVDEALKDVRWYATRGYAEIKIYNSMKTELVPLLAKEAHARGMSVTGHIPVHMLANEAVRAGYDGIEHADSFVVDPHKWLFAPFDCAALVYKNPKLAKAVHTQDASYLDVIHLDTADEWNPTDYAYHLTRRARGLPLWFSLAVHGTRAYTEAVEVSLDLARDTAALIRKNPDLELIREPELSTVLFRRKGWNAEDYQRWSERLLAGQIAFVTPTGWEGETVARFAFLHPHTTLEIVEEILDTMAF